MWPARLRPSVCFPVAFLDIDKVGYDSDGVVESVWTTTAYSCDVLFREYTGKGNIKIYTCAWRPVVSDPNGQMKKV